MDTVVAIFFSGPIAAERAKDALFIRYEIVVAILKPIIDIGDYKAEAIGPKINNIAIITSYSKRL